jgi:hypothetical protein
MRHTNRIPTHPVLTVDTVDTVLLTRQAVYAKAFLWTGVTSKSEANLLYVVNVHKEFSVFSFASSHATFLPF